MKNSSVLFSLCALLLASAGCSKQRATSASETGGESQKAIIAIDGSSTVYPISEAVAEEFQKTNKARVTIGVSGTGGGFKKFCAGDTDISDASRPVKQKEVERCKAAGIGFIELPVAYDGLAVVVNPKNTWVDHFTVAELKKIWAPEAQKKILRWSQVRDGWPDEAMHLFGPGVDSGTYDYFTKAIIGKEHESRGDFTSSEDDNVLVQGVARDRGGLGFFGFAYYVENKDKLKLVPIDDGKDDNGAGPIAPSLETVSNGTYQPLARPIFIYVSTKSAGQPGVVSFIHFYLEHGAELSKEVGYIPLPPKVYQLARARFDAKTTGSVFQGGSKVGVTIESLLASEE